MPRLITDNSFRIGSMISRGHGPAESPGSPKTKEEDDQLDLNNLIVTEPQKIEIKSPVAGDVTSIEISPNERWLAVGSTISHGYGKGGAQVAVFYLKTLTTVASENAFFSIVGPEGVMNLGWSQDSQMLYVLDKSCYCFCYQIPQFTPTSNVVLQEPLWKWEFPTPCTFMTLGSGKYEHHLKDDQDHAAFGMAHSLTIIITKVGSQGMEQVCILETPYSATCCGLMPSGISHLAQPRVAVGTKMGSFTLYILPKPASILSKQTSSPQRLDRVVGREVSHKSIASIAPLDGANKDPVDEKDLDPEDMELNVEDDQSYSLPSFMRIGSHKSIDFSETNHTNIKSRRRRGSILDDSGHMADRALNDNTARGIRELFAVPGNGKPVGYIATTGSRKNETVVYSVGTDVIVVRRIDEGPEITKSNVIETLGTTEQWNIVSRIHMSGCISISAISISHDGSAMGICAQEATGNDCPNASLTVYDMTPVLPAKRTYQNATAVESFHHHPEIKAVCFSSDGAVTYSGGTEHKLFLEQVNSGVSINGLLETALPIHSVAMSERGNRCVICMDANPTENKYCFEIHNSEDIERHTGVTKGIGCIPVFRHHESEVIFGTLLSKNGTLLAVALQSKIKIFKEAKDKKAFGWIQADEIEVDGFESMATAMKNDSIIYLAVATKITVKIFTTPCSCKRLQGGNINYSLQEIVAPDNIGGHDNQVQAIDLASASNTVFLAVAQQLCLDCYDLQTNTKIWNRRLYELQVRYNSISLSAGGELLVTGDSVGKMVIYHLKRKKVVATVQKGAPVMFVYFVGLQFVVLLLVGHRGALVYNLMVSDISMILPMQMVCQAPQPSLVGLSQTGNMIFFNATQAFLYGFSAPHVGHKIYDHPSYTLLEKIMENPRDLFRILRYHPYLLNRVCPKTHKDVVQSCVEKDVPDSLHCFLEAGCPIALHFDNDKESALSKAINSDSPNLWIRLILNAIADKSISNDHESLRVVLQGQFTMKAENKKHSVFEHLGLKYSKHFLNFIKNIELRNSHNTMLAGLENLKLTSTEYKNDAHQHANHIWSHLCSKGSDTVNQGLDTENFGNRLKHPLRGRMLPFKGISMPLHRESKGGFQITPLQVIVEACSIEQDGSVFKKGSLAYHLMERQWKLLKTLFLTESQCFIIYIAISSGKSYLLAWITHEQEIGNEQHVQILIMVLLVCSWIIFALSIVFLTLEFLELRITYKWTGNLKASLVEYLNLANITDLLSFKFQIILSLSIIAYYGEGREEDFGQLRGLASIALIFLYLKLLYYAQGFVMWASTVKIAIKILNDMKRFFAIIIVILIGFAFSFSTMLSYTNSLGAFDDPAHAFLQMTLYLYGAVDNVADVFDVGFVPVVLFELFMILEVLILLNLMITVMADSFRAVKDQAGIDVLLNKAELVVKLEHIYRILHKGKSVNDKDCDSEYPWVHLLEVDKKEEKEDRLAKLEERIDNLATTFKKSLEHLERKSFTALEHHMEHLEYTIEKKYADSISDLSQSREKPSALFSFAS